MSTEFVPIKRMASSSDMSKNVAMYFHAGTTPAAISASIMFFSAWVSTMMESSKDTSIGPKFFSIFAPQWIRAQVSRLPVIVWSERLMEFSCLRMLRMRAELSADTSVAVFRPPDLSRVK